MINFLKTILTTLLILCTIGGAYAQGITKDDVGKTAFFKGPDGRYIKGTITIVNPSKDPLDNYFALDYTLEPYGEERSRKKVLEKFNLSKHGVFLASTISNTEASIGSVVLIPRTGGGYSEATIKELYKEGEVLPNNFWYGSPWIVGQGTVEARVEFTENGKEYQKIVSVDEMFLPPTEPNAEVNVVPPVVPVPKTGYTEILENMASSAVNNISMETAIKSNPDIYSKENVEALLEAGLISNELATAKDYISKVIAINKIANLFNKDAMISAEKGLEIRLYKIFMQKLLSNEIAMKEIGSVYRREFKYALTSYNLSEVEESCQDGLFAAMEYFSSSKKNTILSSKEDVNLIIGTAENEFQDGLLALMEKFDWSTMWSGAGIKMLVLLKLELLGNNDKIPLSTGEETDIVTFFTDIYSVDGKSLALESYAFGSMTKDHFDPAKTKELVWDNTVTLWNRETAVKNIDFTRALESFNRITEIVKK